MIALVLVGLAIGSIPVAVGLPSSYYTSWTDQGIVYTAPASGSAYYPSVLYDANAFSGHGDSYYYKMWYSTGNGIALAYSNDGKVWTSYNNGHELSTLTNAHHNRVLFDAGGFGGSGVFYKIWYMDDSQLYSINAIRYAESSDGITWVNDQAITQDASAKLIDGNPSDWNAGSYGPVWLFYNLGASNSGSSPYGYSYVMYYDATTGGAEQIALAYSSDGKSWKLYGTGPVLADGGPGSWDQKYVTHGSIVRDPGKYLMWYSGGIHQAYEGIGYAESSDGLVWTKGSGNPIFSISDGVSYRNDRDYTPTVVNDGSGSLRMYYSAVGNGGPKEIGLAVTQYAEVDTATGVGAATLTTSAGEFSSLAASAVSSIPAPPPAESTFPDGLFQFTILGLSASQQVTVTITLPAPLPAGPFAYYEFQGGAWTQLPSASLDSTRTVITLTLTADATGTMNDAGGPTNPQATSTTTATTFMPVHQTPVGGVMLPSVGLSVLLPWAVLLSLLGVLSVEAFIVKRRAKRR